MKYYNNVSVLLSLNRVLLVDIVEVYVTFLRRRLDEFLENVVEYDGIIMFARMAAAITNGWWYTNSQKRIEFL